MSQKAALNGTESQFSPHQGESPLRQHRALFLKRETLSDLGDTKWAANNGTGSGWGYWTLSLNMKLAPEGRACIWQDMRYSQYCTLCVEISKVKQ